VGEWVTPLPSEICAQSDPPPSKKRRLQQISAYNVPTVSDNDEKSITGFPTSYRWSADVTLSPQNRGSKVIFVFLNKTRFQLSKVCYKVSLCGNFQRQSCSIIVTRYRRICAIHR